MQSFTSQACSVAGQAFYAQNNGQKYVDEINKKWLEPLPADAKDIGVILGSAVYRKIHIKLNKDFALESTPGLSSLVFRMEF